MQVKICGITRRVDAELAVELGATMLGFVFAASPRRVTAEAVAQISASLPRRVRRIGVFMDASAAEVIQTVRQANLTGVQFHGRETPALIAEVRRALPKLYLIRGVEILPDLTSAAPLPFSDDCDMTLLDSPRALRQPLAISAVLAASPRAPFMVAGGINPTNVIEYLDALRPAGVDLASGVETASPGIKDPARLTALFHRLRGRL